jgi:hypothetical protein
MLFTQTLDKLRTLRLEGMVQALDEQRHQNDIVALGFEDRLALLVERQWLWKENRGLAIRLKNAQLKINASLEDLDSDLSKSRFLVRRQSQFEGPFFGPGAGGDGARIRRASAGPWR